MFQAKIKKIKFLAAALAFLLFAPQAFAQEFSEDLRAQIKELQESVIARKKPRKVSEEQEVIDIGEIPVKRAQETTVPSSHVIPAEAGIHKVTIEEAEKKIETQWGPKEKLKYHYNLGLAYDQGGKFDEAEAEYKKALEICPNDPDVHYNIAIVYDDYFQDKKNAIHHYEKYLDLKPGAKDRENVESWIRWAKQQLALNRHLRE